METPPVIISAPRRSAWWLTVALPILLCVAVLFLFNPSQYGFYPRCMLYTTTGFYCPGCGALRALHQLSHGHLLTALHYNPLLVLLLPVVAYFSLRRVIDWFAGRPARPFVLSPKWLFVALVVMTVFTILRNLPFAPFTWLAPP